MNFLILSDTVFVKIPMFAYFGILEKKSAKENPKRATEKKHFLILFSHKKYRMLHYIENEKKSRIIFCTTKGTRMLLYIITLSALQFFSYEHSLSFSFHLK